MPIFTDWLKEQSMPGRLRKIDQTEYKPVSPPPASATEGPSLLTRLKSAVGGFGKKGVSTSPQAAVSPSAPYWEQALANRGVTPTTLTPTGQRAVKALTAVDRARKFFSKTLPASIMYGPIVGGYQSLQAGRGEEIVPQEAGPERTAYLTTQGLMSGGTLGALPITERARNLQEKVGQVGGEFVGSAAPWEAAFRFVGIPAAAAAGPIGETVGRAAEQLAARFGAREGAQQGARALTQFLTREAVRGGAAGGAIEAARLVTEPPKTAGEAAGRLAEGVFGTALLSAGLPVAGEAVSRFIAKPITRFVGDRSRVFVPAGEAAPGAPVDLARSGYRFVAGRGDEPGLWVRQDPSSGLHYGIRIETRIAPDGTAQTYYQTFQEAQPGTRVPEGPQTINVRPVASEAAAEPPVANALERIRSYNEKMGYKAPEVKVEAPKIEAPPMETAPEAVAPEKPTEVTGRVPEAAPAAESSLAIAGAPWTEDVVERKLLHGTSASFDKFDPAAARGYISDQVNGFYFTDKPDVAERFAFRGGSSDILTSEDVSLKEAKKHVQEILDQGGKAYLDDGSGKPSLLTSSDAIPTDFVVYTFAPGREPRIIEATVRGRELDLRNPARWPKPLLDSLTQSSNSFDRSLASAIKSAAKGEAMPSQLYASIQRSPGLKYWLRNNDISIARIPDAWESGNESFYVVNPRSIVPAEPSLVTADAPEAVSAAPKEPWQMTRAEYEGKAAEAPADFAGSRYPEIVYHGSGADNIEQFFTTGKDLAGNTGAQTARLGAFFSEDPNIARMAAYGFSPLGAFDANRKLTLYEARINLRNPLDINNLNKTQIAELEQRMPGFKAAYEKAKKKGEMFGVVQFLSRYREPTPDVGNFSEWAAQHGIPETDVERLWKENAPAFQEWKKASDAAYASATETAAPRVLQEMGYDGIVVNTKMDSGENLGAKKQYIVFRPEDIAIIRKYPVVEHRQHVEQAIATGKPVPPEVLADYPDLQTSAKATTPAEATPAKATAPSAAQPDVAWTRNLKPGDSVSIKGRGGVFTVVEATKDPSLVTLKSEHGTELKVGRGVIEPVISKESARPTRAFAGPAPSPRPAGETVTDYTQPIRRKAVLDFISKRLGLPIRYGRMMAKGALGEYKVLPRVVRTKAAEDLPVAAHEVFHFLDERYNLERLSQNPAIADELTRLGQATSKPNYSAVDVRKEGVSEFGRILWMDGEEAAKQATPTFFEAFRQTMDPQVLNAIDQIGKMYRDFFSQDAQAHVRGQMVSLKDTLRQSSTLHEKIDGIITNWFDRFFPLRKAARTLGVTDTAKDPYKRAVLSMGSPKKAESFLRFGVSDDQGNLLARPLVDILKPVENRLSDFEDYLAAKHAVELSEKGLAIPFDTEKARETVARLESPEFIKTADDVRRFLDTVIRETLVKSGMLTEETLQQWRAEYPFYAPFYRAPEEGYRSYQVGGTTFANIGKAIKRQKGSTKAIINPLESIVRDVFRFTNLAERNGVGRALLEAADATPGSGWLVERVPVPVQARTILLDRLEGALRNAGIDTEHANLAGEVETLFDARPFASYAENRDHVITVWQNGNPNFAKIGDPNLYEVLAHMNKESAPALIRLLTPAARIFHYTVTKAPAFLVRNVLRDQLTAAVFSEGERLKLGPISIGYVPIYDWFRGLFFYTDKDALRRFQSSGAAQSFMSEIYKNYFEKSLQQVLNREVKGLRRLGQLVGSPRELLDVMSEFSEQPTRLAEFQLVYDQAIKRGASTEEAARRAAEAARKVTLDFGMKGQSVQSVNQIVPFFNANLQDMRTMYEHFTNPKTRARSWTRALAYITVPTLMLYAMNRKDPNYQQLPTYRKDLFWNIPMGNGRFFSIPIPFILGLLFKTVPERIMAWIDQDNPHAFDGLGETASNVFMVTPIPTTMAPALEVWANKDFFRGAPIVPQSEQNLPAELQYGTTTTETAKAIGKAIHASPRKVQHLIRGYSAGYGDVAMQGLDRVINAAEGKAPPTKPAAGGPEDYPVLRSFITRPATSGNAAQMDVFYKERDQADKIYNGLKKRVSEATGKPWPSNASFQVGLQNGRTTISLKGRVDPAQWKELQKQIASMSREDVRLLSNRKAYTKLADDLAKLRDKRRQIEASTLNPEEKRKQINDINLRMLNLLLKAYQKPEVRP